LSLLQSILERLIGLLPNPVFLGLAAILAVSGGFWWFETSSDTLPWDFLGNPIYIAAVIVVILAVVAYYVVRSLRRRPSPTKVNRVGLWLAKLEGDDRNEYLRNLKGQVEHELSSDSRLRNFEVRTLTRSLDTHDEARKAGTQLNAGAVVWGNIGTDLQDRKVSNLKLTVVGGSMDLRSDIQFSSNLDIARYEMSDVARFVAGYGLLSNGRSSEAVPLFDRILEDQRGRLFDFSDALQFGGIACSLATQRTTESKELLEKAQRYFTQYIDLFSEEELPNARAMGFFNLGGVVSNKSETYPENIKEALQHFTEAERLFTRAGDDEGRAMSQIEKGHILSDLYQAENQPAYGSTAHILLENAKALLNKEDHPERYARLQFERGRLFVRSGFALRTGMGVRSQTELDSALAAFGEAFEIYNDGKHPVDAALALLHSASARSTILGNLERGELLEEYEAYQRALNMAPKNVFPGVYAEIQSSVSVLLLDLDTNVSNCLKAIQAAEEALSIQTPEENAAEYSRALLNHSAACLAYSSLDELSNEDYELHLQRALGDAQKALKLVSPSFYPTYYWRANNYAEDAKEKLEASGYEPLC
jgi:tetratricopeptide (TPR) repeat protein